MVIREAKSSDTAIIAAIGQCVWVHTYSTKGARESIAKYVMEEF
jgi:hypothetical protein